MHENDHNNLFIEKMSKSSNKVVLHNNNLTSRFILIFLYFKRCRVVWSQSEETGGSKIGDGDQICGDTEETVWRHFIIIFLLPNNEIL